MTEEELMKARAEFNIFEHNEAFAQKAAIDKWEAAHKPSPEQYMVPEPRTEEEGVVIATGQER